MNVLYKLLGASLTAVLLLAGTPLAKAQNASPEGSPAVCATTNDILKGAYDLNAQGRLNKYDLLEGQELATVVQKLAPLGLPQDTAYTKMVVVVFTEIDRVFVALFGVREDGRECLVSSGAMPKGTWTALVRTAGE